MTGEGFLACKGFFDKFIDAFGAEYKVLGTGEYKIDPAIFSSKSTGGTYRHLTEREKTISLYDFYRDMGIDIEEVPYLLDGKWPGRWTAYETPDGRTRDNIKVHKYEPEARKRAITEHEFLEAVYRGLAPHSIIQPETVRKLRTRGDFKAARIAELDSYNMLEKTGFSANYGISESEWYPKVWLGNKLNLYKWLNKKIYLDAILNTLFDIGDGKVIFKRYEGWKQGTEEKASKQAQAQPAIV